MADWQDCRQSQSERLHEELDMLGRLDIGYRCLTHSLTRWLTEEEECMYEGERESVLHMSPLDSFWRQEHGSPLDRVGQVQ